jgi:capsular polysaccharide transport system ATP-binding protein
MSGEQNRDIVPLVTLEDAAKAYPSPAGLRTVLEPTTATLSAARGIGILGRNGAGKSTLVRMLSGAELPDQGAIHPHVELSWPLGLSGALQGSLTGRENARFVARIYGADPEEVTAAADEFAELGADMDLPVGAYSSGMKARLGFGLSLALDFGCYLIDESLGVGDRRFQEKSRRELNARLATARAIVVSHNPSTLLEFCDRGALLSGGRLELFDDIAEAIEEHHRRSQ